MMYEKLLARLKNTDPDAHDAIKSLIQLVEYRGEIIKQAKAIINYGAVN